MQTTLRKTDMKKSILLVILGFTLWTIGFSQSCLPDGITFTTQSEIDNFQVNYPGCTEIEGDVEINGDSIVNLHGLFILQQISGDLQVFNCNLLKNLIGLDNITNIGGSLHLFTCDSLTSFSGLDSLTSIGEDFIIGGVSWDPNEITSLEVFENLTTIGGMLKIHYCNSLTSLEGLENIDPESINELKVHDNLSLASCEIQSICSYLANPTGSINIYNNASGCNNPIEVANACGITLDCLPFGNYYFLNQYDVDSFQLNYPNCNNISGDVILKSTNITNLNGLNNISNISGSLSIGNYGGGNNRLEDISGLSNLSNIGGHISIDYNDSLMDLTGLNNLSTVGDYMQISSNFKLNNLSGFTNLDSIGGTLTIEANFYLTNVEGFNNLSSLGSLRIWFNDNLETISFENLTNISNDIYISVNDNLSELSGFSNIVSINGNFTVRGSKLHSLSAFSNLSQVGNSFGIYDCLVPNFSDFTNLTNVGHNISISGNDSLIDLTGLENITSIGGYLSIYNNENMKNLSGLNNLNSIGGKLSIKENDSLISIAQLSNLTIMKGELNIHDNNSLPSLDGLDNLMSDSITNIYISDNDSLTSCEAYAICNFLSDPNGTVNIYDNAPGCNSPPEIAAACNIILPCLPFGHYYLYDQNDIDNFQFDYPNCTELAGNVFIKDNEINNLAGLSQITFIENNLSIRKCHNLINLIGLNNLDSIGGGIVIYHNSKLESTEGLESLNYIGGTFQIGNNTELFELSDLHQLSYIGNDFYLYSNPILYIISAFSELDSIGGKFDFNKNHAIRNLSGFHKLSSVGGNFSIIANRRLNSLLGLDSLTNIGGNLYIHGNDSLTSLSGLDNIDNNSIEDLDIAYNYALKDCDVESICAYLLSPGGEVTISNNRVGCSSELEILIACSVGELENIPITGEITIYPNPVDKELTINSRNGTIINQITIYNCIGQIVFNTQKSLNTINLSMLDNGLYIIEIHTNERIVKKKLIIK